MDKVHIANIIRIKNELKELNNKITNAHCASVLDAEHSVIIASAIHQLENVLDDYSHDKNKPTGLILDCTNGLTGLWNGISYIGTACDQIENANHLNKVQTKALGNEIGKCATHIINIQSILNNLPDHQFVLDLPIRIVNKIADNEKE